MNPPRNLRALGAALLLMLALVVPASAAPETSPLLEKRVIGQSVHGRDIVAWHLGEPGTPTYVLIATMHGNEPHTRQILQALRDGPAFDGINVWVVPT